MSYLRIFSIFFLCAILAACASRIQLPDKPNIKSQEFEKIPPYLSAFIEKEMRTHKIMGISIALVSGEDMVWHEGFGYANKKQQQRVNSSTLFRAGSISKLVNALAVMRLVEQGKLSLDAPISSYLPELTIKSRFATEHPITLRNILSHQSGLPSDLIKDMWVSEPPHFFQTLQYLNSTFVAQPPNRAYSYSNLGHDVIGMVIEKVSGETYETYINSLLTLLDMKHSRFSHSPESPKTARGYDKRRKKIEYGLRDVPAAGLTANATDLVQLIRLFARNGSTDKRDLLKRSSLERLLEVQGNHLPLMFNKRIGLGLFYFDDTFHRKISIVGHSGATVNHRSLIKFSAENHYGVAILSNSRNASATINRIANKALALLYEANTGKPAPVRYARWPHKKPADIVHKEALVGHYATIAGLAKVFESRGKLKVKLAGRRFALYQKRPGGFYYLKYKLFGLFPIKLGNLGNLGIALRDVDGKKILIGQNTLDNTQLLGEKLAVDPISDAWRQRTGRYQVLNPIEVIKLPSGGLKIVDGFLVAHAKSDRGDRLEFVLQPVNDQEAIIAGIGRSLGETIFASKEDDAEILHYSNIKFGKIP